MASTFSKGEPRTVDSSGNYFVAKVAAAALSCMGDDLDKIAEDESRLTRPGPIAWLNTLRASVPGAWSADTGFAQRAGLVMPNEEERKRGKVPCSRPEYPVIALRKEATGTATLAFLVEPDGRVGAARVVQSSGDTPSHKLLDATALAYLGECEFKPGTVNGVPVSSWATIQYVWKIE